MVDDEQEVSEEAVEMIRRAMVARTDALTRNAIFGPRAWQPLEDNWLFRRWTEAPLGPVWWPLYEPSRVYVHINIA